MWTVSENLEQNSIVWEIGFCGYSVQSNTVTMPDISLRILSFTQLQILFLLTVSKITSWVLEMRSDPVNIERLHNLTLAVWDIQRCEFSEDHCSVKLFLQFSPTNSKERHDIHTGILQYNLPVSQWSQVIKKNCFFSGGCWLTENRQVLQLANKLPKILALKILKAQLSGLNDFRIFSDETVTQLESSFLPKTGLK